MKQPESNNTNEAINKNKINTSKSNNKLKNIKNSTNLKKSNKKSNKRSNKFSNTKSSLLTTRTFNAGTLYPLFPKNIIRNQRYKWFTFFFAVLSNQFKYFFNIYFFGICFTQLFTVYSVSPIVSNVMPWAIVLSLTLLREGIDDWNRYKRDKEANSQMYKVIRTEVIKDQKNKNKKSNNKKNIKNEDINEEVNNIEEDLETTLKQNIEKDFNNLEKEDLNNNSEKEDINNNKYINNKDFNNENINEIVRNSDNFMHEFSNKYIPFSTIKVPSSNLCVGDILLLEKDQRVPADCVLLKCQEPNLFIRTDQLDGETDWKLRIPALQDLEAFDSIFTTDKQYTIIADKPHKDIYSFVGKIEIYKKYKQNINSNENLNNEIQLINAVPLSLENMLWMNTVLASGHAMCCITYTGRDTRSVMNTSLPKNKFGLIDEELNKYSKFLFALSFLFALVFTIMRGVFARPDATFIRFLVILSNVIPISLKVSIDWARYMYVHYIQKDIKCTVRNSNIPEELGRLSYLLSDKTGTLTCNEMEMKKVHLGSVCYTHELTHEVTTLMRTKLCGDARVCGSEVCELKCEEETVETKSSEEIKIYANESDKNNNYINDEKETYNTSINSEQDDNKNTNDTIKLDNTSSNRNDNEDVNNLSIISENNTKSNNNKNIKHSDTEDRINALLKTPNKNNDDHSINSSIYDISRTTLHSLQSDVSSQAKHITKRKKKDLPNRVYELLIGLSVCHNVTPVHEDGKTSYQASSPDEIALVQWTDKVGMKLIRRDRETIVLRDLRSERVFTILHIFPFTSETKRMGIILKNKSGEIDFYMKGADVVMSRIIRVNDWLAEETDNMAREGLRTLVIARKRLSKDEYLRFNDLYKEASTSMHDRNQKITEAVKTLESDMMILGLTGVEDRLQDGVKLTLKSLRNAGIKIWMLTGDKVETAICISISSKLFSRTGTYRCIENCTTREEAWEHLNNLKGTKIDNSDTNNENENEVNQSVCNYLIIDGKSIHTLMEHFTNEFISFASTLEAVVCCRCSPTQKAHIARALKKVTGKRIACIGDGGNDVSMITEADLGVGIVGKEGKQASLAADFSLDCFKDVNDLILWHGRNCYKGTARLSHLIIHRGTIISVMQAIFCSLFEFSPFSLYHGTKIVGYVTLYTFLPVFCSIMSRDVTKPVCMKYPELYKELNRTKALSTRSFATWNVISFYQGAIIMLLSFWFFEREMFSIISITFSSLIVNELLMIALSVRGFNTYMVLSLFISLLFYVLSFFFLKSELVLPCSIFLFVVRVVGINLCGIVFSVVHKLYSLYVSPSCYSKLEG